MCAAPVRSPCANRAIRRIQRPIECHGAVWTLTDNRSSKTADNASTDCWVRPESRGSLNVQSNDQPSLDAPTTIGGHSQSGSTPRYSLRLISVAPQRSVFSAVPNRRAQWLMTSTSAAPVDTMIGGDRQLAAPERG